MAVGPPDAERVVVAALPHLPRCPGRRRQAPAAPLGGSYAMLVAAALAAGSALRVPAGPVLIMAVLLAANALVLGRCPVRRPLSGRGPERHPQHAVDGA
jgi:hypothetical protein